MTDVALYEEAGTSLMPAGVLDLVAKAQEMDAAWGIAQKLSQTAFVPASFRGKVAETAAAIIAGAEMGMPLMASLRSIDVIDGTPAIRVLAMRAMVIRAGHRVWVEESSSQRVVVKGHRRDDPDRVTTSMWDMSKARTAGLESKANWKKYPEAMLIARATSDVIRLIAPEVILGLPYSAEEVTDGNAFEASDAPSAPEKPKPATRARRKPLVQAPAEEPSLPDEEPTEEPVDAEVVEDGEKAEAAPEDRDEEAVAREAAAAFAEVAEEQAALRLEEPDLDWGDQS